jgi:hypothetical protein
MSGYDHRWGAISILIALCSCRTPTGSEKPASKPTATEVFDLRSKCAALGQTLLQDSLIGPALTQTQISRYNADDNRCYVRLDVSTADLATPQQNFTRDSYLYDGQTRELLAYISLEREKKVGDIFSDSLRRYAHDRASPTYEEAANVIEQFMMEDRKP